MREAAKTTIQKKDARLRVAQNGAVFGRPEDFSSVNHLRVCERSDIHVRASNSDCGLELQQKQKQPTGGFKDRKRDSIRNRARGKYETLESFSLGAREVG